MALEDMHPLSPVLTKFDQNVTPNLGSMETAKSEVSTAVNDAINAYDSAISGISSAIKDPQGNALNGAVQLVHQASQVLKTSMDGDMGAIITECKSLNTIIEQIKQKIQEGIPLQAGFWEKVWNSIKNCFVGQWAENDAGKISKLNQEIDQLNGAGEAQLAAIISAANAVKLGIIGNMKYGGALGAYVNFASNYNFNFDTYIAENPIYNSTILGKAGCFVVGQVEGVVNFFEGIADAGLLLVGGVVDIFDGDRENWFERAAKFDVAGWSTGWAYEGMKNVSWLGYSEGARNVGNFTGEVVAAVVVPYGLALSAVSMVGQTGETALQNGDSGGVATLKGLGAGALTFATGKAVSWLANTPVVSKVTGKIGAWLSGGSKAANAVNKVGGVVGKTVDVATKPAQLTAKGFVKAGGFLTNTASAAAGKLTGRASAAASDTLDDGATEAIINPGDDMAAAADDLAETPMQRRVNDATGVNRKPGVGELPTEADSVFKNLDDAALDDALRNPSTRESVLREMAESGDEAARLALENSVDDPAAAVLDKIDDPAGNSIVDDMLDNPEYEAYMERYSPTYYVHESADDQIAAALQKADDPAGNSIVDDMLDNPEYEAYMERYSPTYYVHESADDQIAAALQKADDPAGNSIVDDMLDNPEYEAYMDQHSGFGYVNEIADDPVLAAANNPASAPQGTPANPGSRYTPEETYREALDDWIASGRPNSGEKWDYLMAAYDDIPQDAHLPEVFNPKHSAIGTEPGIIDDPTKGIIQKLTEV